MLLFADVLSSINRPFLFSIVYDVFPILFFTIIIINFFLSQGFFSSNFNFFYSTCPYCRYDVIIVKIVHMTAIDCQATLKARLCWKSYYNFLKNFQFGLTSNYFLFSSIFYLFFAFNLILSDLFRYNWLFQCVIINIAVA